MYTWPRLHGVASSTHLSTKNSEPVYRSLGPREGRATERRHQPNGGRLAARGGSYLVTDQTHSRGCGARKAAGRLGTFWKDTARSVPVTTHELK